jgi:hypothetical protein
MFIGIEDLIQRIYTPPEEPKRGFICGSSQTVDPLWPPKPNPDRVAFLNSNRARKLWKKLVKKHGELEAKKLIYYKYGAWLDE